ncbi:MAG: rhomboid family intramembrane serine protease [Chloroflexota bacterium]|nr:rhomboid family intramembrane serine protease [Chloroflexota bacterium]
MGRADSLVAEGDYAGAAVIYQRLIGHRDPELHVAALLGLAECRYRLDQEDAAAEAWSLATQAPETPLSWLAWKHLAGARVRKGDLRGAAKAYREAEQRAPPSERAEISSRLGWLSKEMGDETRARGYFSRARAGGAQTPVVTYAILAITIAIGVSTYLVPQASLFLPLLALDKSAVADGQLYRLVTVVLVHSPVMPLHLAGNMWALYLVGPLVEALYGRALFLATYVLTAAAASTASYLLVPNDSVGASGAIFGLFGMLFVATRVHRPNIGRQARGLTSQIGILIAFNLALGFGLGGVIDNAAHVGGLLAGAWIGLVIRPRGATTPGALWQRPGAEGTAGRGAGDLLLGGAALVLLVAVIALGLALGTERYA